MSFRRRRRLALALVAALAAFPLMQRGLVEQWNTSPWELCGFAMYVQPDLPVEVTLRAPSGEPIDPAALGPDAARALARYGEDARALGALTPKRPLAAALAAAKLPYAHVDIEIRRPALEPDGKLGERRSTTRLDLAPP